MNASTQGTTMKLLRGEKKKTGVESRLQNSMKGVTAVLKNHLNVPPKAGAQAWKCPLTMGTLGGRGLVYPYCLRCLYTIVSVFMFNNKHVLCL